MIEPSRTNADRMGYGKPLHEFTEAEREARRNVDVYAKTSRDYEHTDLPGRDSARRPVPAGMHEPFAGR
jgi:hypothetical protein